MNGPLPLLLRVRWRADRGLLVLLVAVVAVTAGLVGAVPRLLDQLQRSSLEEALATSTPDRRGLEASVLARPESPLSTATWDDLREAAASLDVPTALAGVLDPPVPVLDTLRYVLGPPPGGELPDVLQRQLTIRSQLDLPPLEVVEGRLPDGEVGAVTAGTGEVDAEGEPTRVTLPVHEVAMTARTADALGLAVGDQRIATAVAGPDGVRVVPAPSREVVVEVAAIVELPPTDDPVWFGDESLHRAVQFDTNTSTTFFAHAIVPPEAVAELPGAADREVVGTSFRWRLDTEAVLDADLAAVADGARSLRTDLALAPDEPRWSTGLDRLVDRERAQRSTAVEVLGLAVVAVVVVAVSLLGAVALVLASRRRDVVALVRGRGTSTCQAVVAAAVEATVVVGAGAGVAVAALSVLLPGSGGGASVAAVAAVAWLVLLGSAWADVVRPLGEVLAERRRGGRRSVRGRPVLEGLVVVVAVVAGVAARQRGVVVDGEVDTLVIAAPAAVVLAAAVVAARLVPLLLRIAGPVAARARRGLPVPLGVARATRRRSGGPVVLLVTLGVAVAAVAGAVHSSIVAGQARAAAERVGADVRIDAPPGGTLAADVESPSPQDVVADVRRIDGVVAGDLGGQSVDVLLVDADELAAIRDADDPLPSLVWDGVTPAPVVLSAPFAALGDVERGDVLGIVVDGDRVAVSLAAVTPRLLGVDGGETAFVVVERDAVEVATGIAPPSPTSRLVVTDDPDAVVTQTARTDPEATVVVRGDVRSALASAPLALGVRVGFLVAAGAAAAATTLALVLALAAAAPVRRAEAAVLAALGAPDRSIAGAAAAEVVPTVAVSAAAGLATAVGIAAVVSDRVDLAAFTGTVDATTVGAPPLWQAAVLAVAVVAVATVAAVVTIGRVDTAALLREAEG